MSFNNTKGKWIVIIRSKQYPEIIIESSYTIIENYWSIGTHILLAQANNFTDKIPLLWYPEIEKINEDKIKVYIRGYDKSLLPPDFEWSNPDPKLAVRGEGSYAIYQRVK
ncbi:MAG: hypothetical protein ACRCVW_00195 [Brevinema sp.]